MDQNQNMNDEMNDNEVGMDDKKNRGNSGNGAFWAIFFAIVLVVVGVWIWSGNTIPTTPSENATSTDNEATNTDANEPELGEDSPEDIQDQLEGIDLEDLEGEFENIDQDLQDLESAGN